MKRNKHLVVTKRDGTVERFSLIKLKNCLSTVMHKQSYDPRLAGPLARAVALHLEDWKEPSPPTSDYIYRCVRSVLQQTGLTDVADELAMHRRLRRSRRRRIRVLSADSTATRGRRWEKGALVATMQNKYGLRHAVSRFLAGQVEQQVFALDYRTVSRSFVDEMIHNEILAWGLGDEQVLRPGQISPASPPPVGTRQPEKES